jgi:hypothetical protein
MMRALALVLAATAAACRYVPSPIPVAGTEADLAALAGEWTGDYSGTESGRSGTITFSLRAGTDSAYGDVFMVPRGNGNMPFPLDAKADHVRHARSDRWLAVQFVRVRGGTVSGTLEPYVAPDCDCQVSTTFSGRIAGNIISGTFVTRAGSGFDQRGRWSVERRP